MKMLYMYIEGFIDNEMQLKIQFQQGKQFVRTSMN